MYQINVSLSENQIRKAQKGPTSLRLKRENLVGSHPLQVGKESSTSGTKQGKKNRSCYSNWWKSVGIGCSSCSNGCKGVGIGRLVIWSGKTVEKKSLEVDSLLKLLSWQNWLKC